MKPERMTPEQRYAWIVEYIKERSPGSPNTASHSVNVVDRYFVDAYVDACKPSMVLVMFYGADKVPQLGRDLAAMYAQNMLKRYVCGLSGMGGMGFPRWVYDYSLP
jgi:hypothetical protein